MSDDGTSALLATCPFLRASWRRFGVAFSVFSWANRCKSSVSIGYAPTTLISSRIVVADEHICRRTAGEDRDEFRRVAARLARICLDI